MALACLQSISHAMKCRVVLGIAICGHLCTTVGHSFMFAPFNAYLEEDVANVDAQFLSSVWMVTLLTAAVWVNFTGQLVDRFGARPVLLVSGTLQGAALVLLGLAQGPQAVGVAYFFIRLAATETGEFCFTYSVNVWWVERRGVALGILSSIGSLEFAMPAVTSLIIAATSWRDTAIGLGATTGGLVVLGGLLMSSPPKREEPKSVALAKPAEGPEYSLQQAMRTPMLWCLFTCRLLVGMPWAGINFFMASILLDSGNQHTDIAYVSGAMTVAAVLVSPLYGFVFDKLPGPKKHYAVSLMSFTGLLTCLAAASMWWLPRPLGPILTGFMLGCWSSSFIANSVTLAHVFGRRSLGAISGLSMSFRVASSALGPLAFSSMQRAGISSISLLLGLCASQCVGIVAMLLAPLPTAPVKRVLPLEGEA